MTPQSLLCEHVFSELCCVITDGMAIILLNKIIHNVWLVVALVVITVIDSLLTLQDFDTIG